MREDIERDGASNIGDILRRLGELHSDIERCLHSARSSLKQYQGAQRDYAGKTGLSKEARILIQILNSAVVRLKAVIQAGENVARAYEECRMALVVHRFITPDPRPEYQEEHQRMVQDWLAVSEPAFARSWSGTAI